MGTFIQKPPLIGLMYTKPYSACFKGFSCPHVPKRERTNVNPSTVTNYSVSSISISQR